MNMSEFFIRRPIATSLLMLGIAMFGVIAYRALGRANYHFSAEALAFARANAPVTILAFDVRGFFDTLDHGLLKQRLKSLLGVSESIRDHWSA